MFTTKKGTRRGILIAMSAASVPLMLAGCVNGPAEDGAVDFDGVQSATVQIQAEGQFVDPGTLEPTPFGGRGSGFFIDSSGLVVTNNHVVTGAGTLKVWVGGDTSVTYGAQVLGASECLDLAVIKVDGSNFPYMGWYEGDIEGALEVYSAGFPLGDPNFTFTKGIVSKADVPQEDNWASLDHVIEHDARTRGGNSGGPLVAENGRVVGVNYAGIDTLDYNFAIHRDQVLPVLDKLIAGEPVLSLGINAQALPLSDSGTANGIWVSSVKAGGPAAKAGIKPGDVVIDLGGVTMARRGTLQEYCEVIATQGAEAAIAVSIYRPSENAVYEGEINGNAIELVGGSTPTPPVDPTGFVTVSDDSGVLGVSVPSTWSQVSGGPMQANGITMANVTAAPDLAGYSGSWSVPGVSLSATKDTSIGIDQYLEGFSGGVGSQCSSGEPGDYDDGLYVGKYIYWTGCGGGSTDFFVLVAQDVNKSHIALLTVQMVSEEDKTTTLKEILNTFIADL
ncbi:hypothetical protein BH10ACT7_BH10ACT7_31980 [soil metagenome]